MARKQRPVATEWDFREDDAVEGGILGTIPGKPGWRMIDKGSEYYDEYERWLRAGNTLKPAVHMPSRSFTGEKEQEIADLRSRVEALERRR